MNITEFLEARIAEDEAAAGKLTGVAHSGGTQVYTGKAWVPSPITLTRVLAECAAKRAIIRRYQDAEESYVALSYVIEALAAVYKDHADYQEEWAHGDD